MFSDLLNPYILGSALGAAAALGFLGFLLSKLAQRFLPPQFSLAAGFVVAGVAATCVASLGFSDGGDLNWRYAVIAYGLPSAVAAFCALLLVKVFSAEEDKRWIGNLFVSLALVATAIVSSRIAEIEETFSNEELLLSDPLMIGFAALADEYPALWAELSADLKAAEMRGAPPFSVASNFFQEHQSEFTKLASDEAVVDMSRAVIRKLEFLSQAEPKLCVDLAAGQPNPRIPLVLQYEHKLDEAKSLERLIRSSGEGNSGVAAAPEAENIVIGGWERLAAEYPDHFYAIMTTISGNPADDKMSCDGFIQLQKFMLLNSEADFARMSRSALNLDPNVKMSMEGELRMALVSLNAEAAILKQSLPQKLDPITTLVGAEYKGTTFTYFYDLSEPVGDGKSLVDFFDKNSLVNVCSDENISWAINLGATFEYSYNGSDGRQASVSVNSSRC